MEPSSDNAIVEEKGLRTQASHISVLEGMYAEKLLDSIRILIDEISLSFIDLCKLPGYLGQKESNLRFSDSKSDALPLGHAPEIGDIGFEPITFSV